MSSNQPRKIQLTYCTIALQMRNRQIDGPMARTSVTRWLSTTYDFFLRKSLHINDLGRPGFPKSLTVNDLGAFELSAKILLDIFPWSNLKVAKQNLMVGKLDIVMLHIGYLLLLICPSYSDDFVVGFTVVNRGVSYLYHSSIMADWRQTASFFFTLSKIVTSRCISTT